ncbi:Very-long-chain (3R)-3-hydroxyacyl-CoA dehydratase 3 [Halotydeus destructor]|nr:Very-long-chain (3R)-3-hydroxyacyl-CoA dehydratase 3 [Halotydeus destructor]
MLSPFVYWGQTISTVCLRVDLRNVHNPEIELNEKTLAFSGKGMGARGTCDYAFQIEFFDSINPQESFYKLIDRDIQFILVKRDTQYWPRLLADVNKPAWLKVDFDQIPGDDDSAEENGDDWKRTTQNSFRNIGEKDFGRGRKHQISPEEFRKIYLFLYNIFQLVGFLYMLFILTIRYSVEGPSSMEQSYNAIGFVMKLLHAFKIFEVLHPILGYTKSSSIFITLEVGYRLFFIFVMIDGEPRMQTKPVVFYLFVLWTMGEIIRYPYQMLKVFDVDTTFLAWLHYTAWIVLYPLAFICEGVILLRNVPYFDETNRYSLMLPNALNISFSMPVFIRLYLLLGLFPFFCMSMSRMYKKRVMKFGPKSWKKKYQKEC